jgi:hypothetical protein
VVVHETLNANVRLITHLFISNEHSEDGDLQLRAQSGQLIVMEKKQGW